MLYILATDAWTSWVQQRLDVPCTISVFADDAQTTHIDTLDLLRMQLALEVADSYMNLRVLYVKCRLLPLGSRRHEFGATLASLCDQSHPFRNIQIVDAMRVLGWWVGSGDTHELDVCVATHATADPEAP
eukprot:5197213-Amphidinium_carterae.2